MVRGKVSGRPLIVSFPPAKSLKWELLKAWLLLVSLNLAFFLGLVLIIVFGFGLAALLLDRFFSRLSPPVFLLALVTLGIVSVLALLTVFVITVISLRQWRFWRLVTIADQLGGDGEAFRNALDLAQGTLDGRWVSSVFARNSIAGAWALWTNGVKERLCQTVLRQSWRRTLTSLGAGLLLMSFFLIGKERSGFAWKGLLEHFQFAFGRFAFERSGGLSISLAGNGTVPRGATVPFTVTAHGGIPSRVRVYWAGDVRRQIPLRVDGLTVFLGQVKVTDSGILWAESGSKKSPTIRLIPLDAPKVTAWRASVDPPDYTGEDLSEWSGTEPAAIPALKGSVVTVTVETTTPILAGRWAVNGQSWAWESNKETSSPSFFIRLPVRSNLSLSLEMKGPLDLWHQQKVLDVKMKDDRSPNLTIIPLSQTAMAGGRFLLRVQSLDDYGISSFSVRSHLGDQHTPRSLLETRILPTEGAKEWVGIVSLSVPVTQQGTFLWIRGTVTDNDTVSGPKSTSSRWVRVPIQSPDDWESQLQTLTERIRNLLRALTERRDQNLSRILSQMEEDWSKGQPWSWIREGLRRVREALARGDPKRASEELERLREQLERSLAEQRLAVLAQELSALRSLQHSIYQRIGEGTLNRAVATVQKEVASRLRRLEDALDKEREWWQGRGEERVANRLSEVLSILGRTPAQQAMSQTIEAVAKGDQLSARQSSQQALADLTEAERMLTSPTQSPLTEAYRSERNRLAQLLAQTEKALEEQRQIRKETEGKAHSSRESEELSHRQGRLADQWLAQRPQFERAVRATPQLGHETLDLHDEAGRQMTAAAERLAKQSVSETLSTALDHQMRAERALERLAEALRQFLQSEQGNVMQRFGAGENELLSLAQRQLRLMRETQELDRSRRLGKNVPNERLGAIAGEEGAIQRSLTRIEGLLGEALTSQARDRLSGAQRDLSWIQQRLLQGETGTEVQQRQESVTETLWQLARALGEGQGQQGQESQEDGDGESRPADDEGDRFQEHGPPMEQIPEPKQADPFFGGIGKRSLQLDKMSPIIPMSRILIPHPYWSALEKMWGHQRR
ncbi:MAG: hypothetical protein NZ959_00380 [Armatimonadetes bacterium]|nr:hypothetical protein [Armatimonadota bacterium]MDW8120770.1 hypothetical protein [Armatimonadota bacterium]